MRFLSFLFLFSTPLLAQNSIGDGGPGSGGLTPSLSCPQAWMGRPSFSFEISNGLGGAQAYFGISARPDIATFNGAPLWMDLSAMVFTQPLLLNGAAGTPGAGSASIPLAVPPMNPLLVGRSYFAQTAVRDSGAMGGWATTNGIEVILTLQPQVFVGYNSPWYLVDGLQHQLSDNGSVYFNIHGAAYTPGGMDLFVPIMRDSIQHANFQSGSAVWSTFATLWDSAYGMEYDPDLKRLWSLVKDVSTGQYELTGYDADSASPNYGSIIARTNGANALGHVEIWSMAPNKKLAAVHQVFGDDIYIWNLDPASPNYLQKIMTVEVPNHGGSMFVVNTDSAWSSNGGELFVAIQHTGSVNGEIARYSFGQGAWIDHNTLLAGVQDIGETSDPPVMLGSAPTCLSASNVDDFMIVSGFGNNAATSAQGWVTRLDYSPGQGTGFQIISSPSLDLEEAWECSLSPEEDVIAVGTYGAIAGDIQFLDASTLSPISGIQLPNARNVSTLAWR